MPKLVPLLVASLFATSGLGLAQAPPFREFRRMMPAERSWVVDVLARDWDGDGDVDVVVANGLEGGIFVDDPASARLYRNDGVGLFTYDLAAFPSKLPPLNARKTYGADAADVDGDGDLDLMAGTNKNRETLLYLNDGGGIFTDESDGIDACTPRTLDVDLGDLDGDGAVDAFWSNFPGGGCKIDLVLLGDGLGGFLQSPGSTPPITTGAGVDATIADLDGDGDLDVARGAGNILRNSGSGSFALVDPWPGPGFQPVGHEVAVADLDQDGKLDLVFSGVGPDDDGSVQLRTSGLNYAKSTALPSSFRVRVADADGDGDADITVGEETYANDGSGAFALAGISPPTSAGGPFAWDDLDADGDVDILFFGFSRAPELFLNDGAGSYAASVDPFPGVADTTWALALGDVDGDGDLDVLESPGPDPAGQSEQLYRNDGTGRFVRSTEPLPESYFFGHRELRFGDADNDGDPDVFGLPLHDEALLHWRNDGSGSFVDAGADFAADLVDGIGLALGDVDGDSYLDVVVANDEEPNRVYLGMAGTGFSSSSALPSSPGRTMAPALADVDGDGDLDLFLGRNDTGPFSIGAIQNELWLNDGAAGFTNVTGAQLPGPVERTRASTPIDVDTDGWVDVVFSNQDAPTRVHVNLGGGVFDAGTGTLPVPFGPDEDNTVPAVADLDGDGVLDLVVGSGSVLLGDGAGGFTNAGPPLPPHLDRTRTEPPVLGDLDRDGDVDAIFPTEFDVPPLLVFNVARHVGWRALPRVGKPLTLDLHGPAFEPWRLLLGLDPGRLALPPYGLLQVDPDSARRVASGFLDGDGLALWSKTFADDPAFLGLEIFWQALVGYAPRFTNLERTVLSEY